LKYIKHLIVILLLNSLILAEENLSSNKNNDFLTKFEYAFSLYNNPRGLSCARCHGKYGKKIMKFPFKSIYFKNFKAKKKNKYIIFPPINNLTKEIISLKDQISKLESHKSSYEEIDFKTLKNINTIEDHLDKILHKILATNKNGS